MAGLDSRRDDVVTKTRPELINQRHTNRARPPFGTLYVCIIQVLEKVARRVQDDEVMHLLKMMLKATGEKGVPQGGVISPLLSNLYLTEMDRMLERAIATTRYGKYTAVQ